MHMSWKNIITSLTIGGFTSLILYDTLINNYSKLFKYFKKKKNSVTPLSSATNNVQQSIKIFKTYSPKFVRSRGRWRSIERGLGVGGGFRRSKEVLENDKGYY